MVSVREAAGPPLRASGASSDVGARAAVGARGVVAESETVGAGPGAIDMGACVFVRMFPFLTVSRCVTWALVLGTDPLGTDLVSRRYHTLLCCASPVRKPNQSLTGWLGGLEKLSSPRSHSRITSILSFYITGAD